MDRNTTYTYDAGKQYLTSVEYSNVHTIRYSYNSNSASPSAHALSEVEHPNGSHEVFSYNAEGKVASNYFNDHKEEVAIEHSASGKVSATDLNGIRSEFFIDHRGLTAKAMDSIGRSVMFDFDHEYNLVKTTDPMGRTNLIAYNNIGAPIAFTDPLGHDVSLTHQDDPLRIKSLADSRDHQTLYEYNASGKSPESP